MINPSRLLLLFDTNVLVYAATPNGGPKSLQAGQVVFDAIRAGVAVVSSQNMMEFFRATTRVRPGGPILSPGRATAYVDQWLAACDFLEISEAIVREACRGAIAYQMRVYDAALWATAKVHGVPVIVSEDGQSQPRIEGVRYVNPFAPAFKLADIGL